MDAQFPLMTGLTALVVIAIALSLRNNWRCSAALTLSLVSAALVVHFDHDALHVHVLFVCSFICVMGISIDDNEVNYVVSFLYLLRMVNVTLMTFGVYGLFLMWEVSAVILTLQVLLIIGGSTDAYSERLDNWLSRTRIGTHNRVASFFRPNL